MKKKDEKTQALERIVAWIKIFDDRCEEAEHTDTGDAWDLFHDIRDEANRALKKG